MKSRITRLMMVAAIAVLVLVAGNTVAWAQNSAPPSGAILDLSGQPLPGGGNQTYQQYTADFTATGTSATITFAFRDDVAYISFANVSVVDVTTDSAVPLANNDFSQGGVGSTPVSWTWANVSGTGSEGVVQTGPPYCYTELYCWYDGSSQGYDTISQAITTVSGHNYQVSFFVAENSFCSTNGNGLTCNFSDTSSASSPKISGTDVVVYVAGGTPLGTQTLTLALLDGGTGTVTDNVGTLTASNCYEAAGIVYQGGNVQTSGTCTATYPVGTELTLTAAPNVPTATNPLSTFGAPASGQVLAIPGWGGACSPTKTNPSECNLTMNSAESVTAAFVVQGQAAAETLTPGTPTTFPFNGGYTGTGGFDFVGQLTQGTSTTGVVNAVPMDPGTCNTIIDAAFPGAYCFVYQLSSTPPAGPPPDSAQMFELTCPDLPGGMCGTVETSTFFATLSSDFTFNTGENPGLSTPGPEGSQTLEYGGGNPYVGVVKFEGPDPYHPCYLPTGVTAPSPSNQVISFNFVDGNPGAKPATGGAGGTASCWIITYNMLNEVPTVSITAGPTNNQDIPLNTPTNAAFTCTAVNNSNVSVGGQPVGAVGPFLTVNSCTLTDTYTGAGSPAVISATAGSASANGSGGIDTSNPGPHTLVATVMDSAENTISASTITYNVQGSSSTVVSSSPNPSTYGQLVTFTATVSGVGTPTGTVTWGGVPGCTTSSLISGVATCTVSTLTVGNYTATTTYPGDNYNSISNGTMSPINPQVVNPATPTATLAVTNSPVTYTGSAQAAVVSISSSSISGAVSNVQYNGSATVPTAAGTYAVTANFVPNDTNDYNTLTSLAAGNFVIKQAAQTITVTTPPPASATYGSNFPVAATASSGLGVAITSSGSCSGSGTSSATITITSSTGTCSVMFNQAGNSNYSAAPTVTDSVTVGPPVTLTPATVNFPTTKAGKTSTAQVILTNTGNVTLKNISVTVSESDSDEFTATSCPSTLAAGAKCTITVTYHADSDDRGGTTAKLVVKDSAPSPYNQLVTILNGKSD